MHLHFANADPSADPTAPRAEEVSLASSSDLPSGSAKSQTVITTGALRSPLQSLPT